MGGRAQNAGRYPLAAKLVIVEFQLRRAKESKISKLWLKTTMKKKREACYEKEEADKFRGSNKWFADSKRRLEIS